MNSIFKRWIHDSLECMPSEFSSQMVLADIMSKHGSSPYVLTSKGIGMYLSRLDTIIKISQKDGRNIYMVKK